MPPARLRAQRSPHAAVLARALLVALVIAVPPAAARADNASQSSVPAKARALADRGRMLHDAGDYANAIVAFTQAYVMAPSPALLFNLAQAYRLQGDCDDAALMYRRYLATGPGSEGRALAENHLANVERCLHKLALHIPVETPANAAMPPPVSMSLDAPAPSHAPQIEKDVGVGLLLGGGVALAGAAYYALQARSAEDDVAAAYAKGMKWKDIAPIDQRGKSAASSAQLLAGGAAFGVASGIAVYLLGRHSEQLPVTVAPINHGVSAGMSWAF